MSISVVMATYNGAHYISDQIESLAGQTVRPDEIVVVDDASRDDTAPIARALTQKYGLDLRFLENQSNLGYVRTFERGLGCARGDIIFLADQDDWWLPGKIAQAIDHFKENPETMVVINNQYIGLADLTISPPDALRRISRLGYSERWFVAGCCTALRREFLPVVLPFPQGLRAHDAWINKLAIYLGVRQVLRRPLQIYRRHGLNETSSEASRERPVSQIGLWFSHGLNSALPGWKSDLAEHKRYFERLGERSKYLSSIGLDDAAARALAAIREHERALEQRIFIASIGRRKRPSYILKAWRDGAYNRFSGWRSALKDVIRY